MSEKLLQDLQYGWTVNCKKDVIALENNDVVEVWHGGKILERTETLSKVPFYKVLKSPEYKHISLWKKQLQNVECEDILKISEYQMISVIESLNRATGSEDDNNIVIELIDDWRDCPAIDKNHIQWVQKQGIWNNPFINRIF